MRYVSKTLNFDCYVNIKCQGTSSMAYPKKNFSIRTYDDENLENKMKLNFKNWGDQYKFVLKENLFKKYITPLSLFDIDSFRNSFYYNKSHLENTMSYHSIGNSALISIAFYLSSVKC